MYQEYNKTIKNIWSTKIVQEYVSAKVNKSEMLQRFLNGINEKNNIKEDEILENKKNIILEEKEVFLFKN